MMIEVDSCEIHRKNPIGNEFCIDDYVLVRKYKEAIWVMITLLAKIFIKDRDHIKEQKVRTAYGILSGAVGIFLNLCLFVGKFMAGFLSGSIAITADAFNNLSDAGSSIITLLSCEESCCSAGNNQAAEQAGITQHSWQLSSR